MVLIALVAVALHIAPILLLAALKVASSDPKTVLREISALSIEDHAAAIACMHKAHEIERRTLWYDVSAPIVMLYLLPFVKRAANTLPSAFANWDNNVSLNGDGEAVFRDGRWLTAGHGLSWEDFAAAKQAGERIYKYSDLDYGGDAYYARGHHPRSFWARYVWIGLRNRASQLSVEYGVEVAERPVCISGNPDIHRNGPYGHFLLKSGNCYHYKSINRWHGLALIRSYGYKLEIVRNSQDGTGLAAAVAIGRSLKRRKA